MQLPDHVYDVLKWIVMIVIPALTTAYVGLAAIWGFPYAEETFFCAATTAKVSSISSSAVMISR